MAGPLVDGITTLRGAKPAHASPPELPKSTPVEIAPTGSGVQKAVNPLLPLVGRAEYENAQAEGQALRAASTAPVGGAGRGADIVAKAKEFVGTPYKWGGTSPLGFDCSGFTQYVFKQLGIDLPRISYQQGQGGVAVDPNQMQPGDLVLWDNSSRNNGADHVAVYIGNGQIIAAPKPGDHVRIQSLYGNYFARRYI